MKTVKFIYDILRKFPLLISFNIALVVSMSIMDAASIFSLAPVVDYIIPIQEGNSGISQKAIDIISSWGVPISLGSLMAIFIILNALSSCFAIWVKYSILKTKYAFEKRLMLSTFQIFFNSRWYFFSNNKQGTLLNTFLRELDVVGGGFGAIANLFANLMQVGLYLVVPVYISWKVTGISLTTALFFITPFFLLGNVSRRLGQLSVSTGNRLTGVISESFSSAKVILGFGNQNKSADDLESSFDAHCDATIKSQTLNHSVPKIYLPLGLTVMAVAVLSGKKLAVPNAELAVLMYSLLKILPLIGNMIGKKLALDNFFPSYEQILKLRELAEKTAQPSGKMPFNKLHREVVIKEATFAYPNHAPVLTGINVTIPKGNMVAFVGSSGAGKSTLIDIIMGFNQPCRGEVLIDGMSLNRIDIVAYRRRIGYVPQDSLLFNMSINDNLLWAKSDASRDEIHSACKLANAHEFIRDLPQKYDTIVGDRGVRLSGGQVQRIALARAVLRNPEILILDEATSSLDTQSERLIQQAVENISKATTVIAIAHRLSTIVNADYIYLLEMGRVVEEGSYLELTQKNGKFKQMAKLQILGEIR